MNRLIAIVSVVAVMGAVFWYFPLFQIVRAGAAEKSEEQPQFNASKFANDYWSQRFLPALDQAVEVEKVLETLGKSPREVRQYIGRKVGMSRSRIYLVKGSGQVVAIEKDGVRVAVGDDQAGPAVLLQTKFLFGNVVRDATGLLEVGDYAHSQDFNDISTELNRIVEERVIAGLKKNAKVGQQIRFVGCAEIADTAGVPQTLELIPLVVNER